MIRMLVKILVIVGAGFAAWHWLGPVVWELFHDDAARSSTKQMVGKAIGGLAACWLGLGLVDMLLDGDSSDND